MKLTPFQLGALVVGGFASIVLLNVLAKYQSSADFREQLTNIKPADILSIRNKRVAEEMMQPVATGASGDDNYEPVEETDATEA